MPTYTYKCTNCGLRTDYNVPKMGDSPDSCRDCGSPKLRRSFDRQTFAVRGKYPGLGRTVEVREVCDCTLVQAHIDRRTGQLEELSTCPATLNMVAICDSGLEAN